MIIGIDASRANVKQKTGTEWYAYNLIEEFKQLADPEDQFILYSKEELHGNFADLPNNFKNKILNWPPRFLWTQLRLAWEMLFHRPDILFVPAHTIPIIHPKKTIITLHDIGFERYEQLYSQKEIGPNSIIAKKILKILIKCLTLGKYSNTELDYHRWSTKFALKNSIKIITISKFSKNEIANKFNVHGQKISVISNAYHTTFKKINDQYKIKQVLSEHGINDPFLLYLGRFEEKKNTAGLIQGFGIFKHKYKTNHKLVLIGKPGYGYNKIRYTITKLRLENEVKILGWVPNENLPYLMNAATAFLFPSFYEGFGIPILEAMACGTPVITSINIATEEIAGGAAILIDPYQPEQIANAINRIITDHELRQKLIKQGNLRAEQFSWQKTAEQTLKLIKSI